MKPNKEKDKWILENILNGRLTYNNNQVYDNLLNKVYKQYIHNRGYISIYIKASKTKYYIYLLHRFVWIYFYGEIPDKLYINHKDGNKQNNDISNLELVTNQENVKHAYSIGLNCISEKARQLSSDRMKGEKNCNSKLSDMNVELIRVNHREGISIKSLAECFNVSYRTIINIVKYRSHIF